MNQQPLTTRRQKLDQHLAATAPVWAAMHQRHKQSRQAIQDRHSRLWEGFSVNDVVILSHEITKASYGLNLCDDAGEAILMDGILVTIEGDFARVRIGRHQNKIAPGRGSMVGELHLIKRTDIVRVSDKPPTLWGNAKEAMRAAAQRDGRQHNRASFWENA